MALVSLLYLGKLTMICNVVIVCLLYSGQLTFNIRVITTVMWTFAISIIAMFIDIKDTYSGSHGEALIWKKIITAYCAIFVLMFFYCGHAWFNFDNGKPKKKEKKKKEESTFLRGPFESTDDDEPKWETFTNKKFFKTRKAWLDSFKPGKNGEKAKKKVAKAQNMVDMCRKLLPQNLEKIELTPRVQAK